MKHSQANRVCACIHARALSLAAITATLSLAALSSCSRKSETPAFTPRLDSQSKSKIEIVGRYQNFEALEAEFDRFNDFYPNVELSYTYLDNYKSSISTALAGEDAPDIFMTFPWMLDKLNYNPLLENAENLADEKATGIDLSSVNQKLLYYAADGSVPMVPILCAANGMLVNEDLFKKEGIAIPEDYPHFLQACQKFKEAGYKSPVLTHDGDNSIMPSLVFPSFTKEVMGDDQAIAQLNSLAPQAGSYMRSSLEWLQDFKKLGIIDRDECRSIKDNYSAVIMRFFEGDVPMMLASSDVVSGTKKRESLSKAFTASPFTYRFYAVPTMEEGAAVLQVPSVEFSVNKNGKNLAMANEFMRFLLQTRELNNLAKIKRLITCSTQYSFDDVYAPIAKAQSLYQLEIGIMDNAYSQLRLAGYKVFTGAMTVDQAIAAYGKL